MHIYQIDRQINDYLSDRHIAPISVNMHIRIYQYLLCRATHNVNKLREQSHLSVTSTYCKGRDPRCKGSLQ